MMTNEIAGLPIVNGTERYFSNTLDRLTEKVKAQKTDISKKKKFLKNEKNKWDGEGQGDTRIKPEFERKRKAPLDQNGQPKRTRVGNEPLPPGEKPDWKAMKQERKKLKESRKKKDAPEVYELSKEAKLIWEDLRQESCPKDKRATLSKKLYTLIQPWIKKLVLSHDIVRVIECLVAVGGNTIRDNIFDELKEDIATLIKDKYAHFFVLKMLKYGDKTQRSFIMKSFEGNVVSLLRRRTSAAVVESAYNDYANAKERCLIIQEFFGPEFRHFKDEAAISLEAVLEKHPQKREGIIRNFKQNLLNVISKSPWKLTLVHTLLKEFLTHCDAESRADLVELLKNDLLHLVHTRDGAKVAMICIWNSNPKNRKAIVKSFKTHVEKMCTDENGYLVMLSLLDAVDDTILVSKALLQEMMENIDKVLQTEQGRKVVLYLIHPRNTAFFHPQLVEILAKGDDNPFSKKDKAVRSKELLESVCDDLLGCFERNFSEWANNNNILIVLKALVESSLGTKSQELKALLTKIIDTVIKEPATIAKTPIFKLFKTLIQNDKTNSSEAQKFTDILLSKLEESKAVGGFIKVDRGIVTFNIIIETEVDEYVGQAKKLLKPHQAFLKKETSNSAKQLISHLNKN